ncbi:MAG: hypothetical protein ABSG70_05885 [Terriglobales bacterium]|jgi:hypothetical protein
MKTRRTASYSCLLSAAALLLLIAPAFAGEKNLKPFVIQPDKVGVSQTLREIAKTTPPPQFHGWIVRKEHETPNHMTQIFNIPDPVIQDSSEAQPELAVSIGLNFDGMDGSQAGGVIPPDTNGAVGDNQFFLVTNFAFNIYNKSTGALEVGPLLINSIWKNFGGQCQSDNGGDPVVLYDKMANRWLLEQLEYNSSYQICFAVSQTDDATGAYNLYSYTFNGLTDYPKLGIWPDAYYLAFNFFGPGDGEPCALDRSAMLAGTTAAIICFAPNTSDMGFLPSDIDGSTPPPSGAPNHYIELGNSNTTLKEYDFHVDFNNPSNSTFTGPNTLTVPAYTVLCGGGGGACIPQPGHGGLLDALGDRMMFRNAYRNFGDHEAMVFSHSVAPGAGSTAVAAERWYELRSTPPGGSFSLYQAGTYQNATDNYWMGSVALDKDGDMALGFSVDNSKSLVPSIWFTGRKPTDKLNTLEGKKVAHKGKTIQGQVNRWGDYSSMSLDPTDDCTFWYTQEYSDGGYNWQSHVVQFKFTTCK